MALRPRVIGTTYDYTGSRAEWRPMEGIHTHSWLHSRSLRDIPLLFHRFSEVHRQHIHQLDCRSPSLNGGAILTPTNEAVVGINDDILKWLPGEVLTFHADDTGDINDGSHEDFISFCSPTHASVMLLRNLDPIHGHFNGTQITILRTSTRCLEVRLNGGALMGRNGWFTEQSWLAMRRTSLFS